MHYYCHAIMWVLLTRFTLWIKGLKAYETKKKPYLFFSYFIFSNFLFSRKISALQNLNFKRQLNVNGGKGGGEKGVSRSAFTLAVIITSKGTCT